MVVWKSSRPFSYSQPANAHLNDLSAKDLSNNDVLVNEGILDAHAATQVNEVVAMDVPSPGKQAL